MEIYSIILAGGSGTRLWPLSRKYYPKQFIQLEELDNESLFQRTLKRAEAISGKDKILIVTNSDYKFHCMTQSEEIGVNIAESQILIEPMAKNTLPAIAFAMKNIPENSLGLILPSDQMIDDDSKFLSTITASVDCASKSLVTFGIHPTHPHTGYGYICAEIGKYPAKVQSFKEKPDVDTARKYIQEGYFWNAGIFLFSKEVFFSELKKHNPGVSQIFENETDLVKIFERSPDLSIDYGLLEHSDNIYVSPLTLYWSDLWSFDALDDYLDEKKVSNPNVISVDSDRNFVLSENKGKKVAIIGADDLIVVDTKDALLISKKGETQKIKDVVKTLKDESSPLADYGVTVYRPWGSYTIIDEGEGFKSKRLTVLPGKKLSLQLHHRRSEHWVVVSGTAGVTVGEKEMILKRGESVFVPVETKHRLANPGTEVLHLIESQIGDYLEEDDIVRFNDDFGRV